MEYPSLGFKSNLFRMILLSYIQLGNHVIFHFNSYGNRRDFNFQPFTLSMHTESIIKKCLVPQSFLYGPLEE